MIQPNTDYYLQATLYGSNCCIRLQDGIIRSGSSIGEPDGIFLTGEEGPGNSFSFFIKPTHGSSGYVNTFQNANHDWQLKLVGDEQFFELSPVDGEPGNYMVGQKVGTEYKFLTLVSVESDAPVVMEAKAVSGGKTQKWKFVRVHNDQRLLFTNIIIAFIVGALVWLGFRRKRMHH